MSNISRNAPCPCGSGKKYKQCCAHLEDGRPGAIRPTEEAISHAFQIAFAHHQAGRLAQAEAIYQRILQVAPKYADVLHLLGLIAHQFGRLELAAELIGKSIAVAPNIAEAHYNLGVVFQDQDKLTKAVDSYQKAISLKPNYVEAHANLGAVLQSQGKLAEAVASCQKAIALNPGDANAHNNLGNALKDQGKLADAIPSYQEAIRLDPDNAEAHSNLGFVLQSQDKLDEAIVNYRKAISLKPDFAEAYSNLGFALQLQSKLDEAIAVCQMAISLNPEYAAAHNNLGMALSLLNRMDEALKSYRRALEISPNNTAIFSNLLFYHNYLPDLQAAALDEARQYGRRVSAQARPFDSWQGAADPSRRLRIGFVSGDLREHPVGYFLEDVLAELSKKHLDLYAYPSHTKEDALSQRIRPHFAAWRPLVGMNAEKIACLIRDDAIDILFDLSGHTAGNCLPVFAWKPAPVQLSWLGYCATTGMTEMDYYLADAWTLPPFLESQFTETIWRLPESYLCLSRPAADVAVSELPALTTGDVTFGSFNNLNKMNDAVVALWVRVLKAVPESRLLLKAKQLAETPMRQNVIKRFAAQGIAAERLLLQGNIAERSGHLGAYRQVDIGLDPFPYNGVTTTVEALWMGVPVLTLAGERFLSRQGVGILTQAGLPEWIARDADDLVTKAVAHASDVQGLAALRKGLRQQLQASPLFDAPRFAAHFDTALREMWQIHQRQRTNPG